MKLLRSIIFQARRQPQAPAVAFGGGVASYASLIGATGAAVEVLQTLGLPRGAFVLLDIRNPIHHVAMMYALALSGMRSASVGTTSVTDHSGPKPDLFLTDREDAAPTSYPMRKVDARWFSFDAAKPIDHARLMAMPGFPNPDDVVRYVYSSGTTGRPKCVALTNASLEVRVANLAVTSPMRNFTGASINLMGFSTIAGFFLPVVNHTRGSLLCFSSSNAETLQMIRLFGVATMTAAVTQLQGVLDALGREAPPPSLRGVAFAGSKLPSRMLTEVRSRLTSNVAGAYGSTEMGVVTTAEPRDLERHEGAVGFVYPGFELQVVSDSGVPLPAGKGGIIRVRSPEQAFYVDGNGQPAETLQDGWFYPGDYGYIEPDGLLVITGRTSEIINRGGVIVAPDLIEEALRLDPAVSDVAVVAVPGANGLDEIWAAIVSPAPLEEARIMAGARQRLNERAPDKLFQIDALPRAESGKVQRNALRDLLLKQLSR
ncbi:MAG: hypothetical protein JWQ89_3218 [Devosia sp.]|uniref:class I adenylate-forming enzyme family protein n=1 Tax=Devosia sp. TaxID=1871048 RepID=UPI00261F7E80|nr:class I adenylate-forming enzyme family protein [Devosia sp.]MDB5541491.1 hypothetical protein [Devosia sp.]